MYSCNRSLPNGYRVDFRRLVDEGNPPRASDYLELLSMQKSTRVRDEFAEHAVAMSLSLSLKPMHGRQGPKIRTREPRRIQLSSPEPAPQAALPHTPCWSQREAADEVLEDVGDVGLNPVVIFHNTSVPELVEHALAHEPDAHSTAFGALAVLSAAKMGLSMADRRVVRDSGTAPGLGSIYWGRGSPNVAMSAREFGVNRERAVDYLNTLPRLYVIDGYLDARTARGEEGICGGDERPASAASSSTPKQPAAGRIKIRIVTGRPSHALFARQFLLRPFGNEEEELAAFGVPDFTLYDAGDFPANRAASFASSSTLCTLSFQHREAVILGTQYLGELRDALMTYVDGRLLEEETLCLRGALNFVGEQEDRENKSTTLILGLPGTGKSILAANCPGRHLMAQDGIGWDSQGTFALAGGCYVKAAGLSPERESLVHAAAVGFGSILENVTFDGESRQADFDDTALTENIRAAFPLQALIDLTNRKLCRSRSGTLATMPWKTAGHPTDLILLCCDAYGVLPPVASLTELQALYYFLSGYTTRVTQHPETGDPEVSSAFSPCFWASPLLAHPCRYTALLRDRLKEQAPRLWILNTGWVGGGLASGGRRIPLEVSRAIINAIQSGEVAGSYPESSVLPMLGLSIPSHVPGIDDTLLHPRELWADGGAYDAELRRLASLFVRVIKAFLLVFGY